MSDIPLLLFAKAPIPGRVKTRLQTNCSAQQAAEIACLLMEASIQKACLAWPGRVLLSAWLDTDHAFFQLMQSRYPLQMVRQCVGDLGEKMRHALQMHGYPAAVMGCDAPHVTADTLRQAHASLSGGRSIIGPSEDGGYYLLGLCEPCDSLFENMPWGSTHVLSRTLNAAQRTDCHLQQLAALNDVDEWQDLLSLADSDQVIRDYLLAHHLIDASSSIQ